MKIRFFLFFLFINFAYAENIDIYLKKAEELSLYKAPQWKTLLHYKKNIFGSEKSLMEKNSFFLSKNGNFDLKDEMIETIKGFYSENLEDSEKYQHPICQFPARFDFLNSYLHFKNLPNVNCEKFNEFYSEINPESLSIIFPTTYMNNPASMFGHTLMRIDRKKSFENNSHINSIIINYGADTKGETNGIIYAFRGVFGLYKGFFSAMPYYKMTNNYNNLENRDIWEYKLNYSQKEVEFYTKHMWELMFSDTKYYFFRKNCSYYILETLNVIHPEEDLTKKFKVYTAPIETIKILDKNNLISNINYRPSLQKKIEKQSKNTTRKDKKEIKKFIKKDNLDNIKLEDKNSYQIAYQFLEYNKVKGKIDLKTYREKSFILLKNINSEQQNELKIDTPISPDNGHKIQKAGISYGRFNHKNYIQLNYKPSYHELIDYNDGYDKDSEISFFSTQLRYFYNDDKLMLDKFDFLKIKSFSKQNSFFKPMSFSVLLGINNLYNDNEILLLDTNGGITLGNDYFSTFLLFGPKIAYSGIFKGNAELGLNSQIGFRIDTKFIKTIVEFKLNNFIKNEYNYNQLNLENNFIITKDILLNLQYQRYFYRKFNDRNDFNVGIKVLF